MSVTDAFAKSLLDTDAARIAATQALAEKMAAIFLGRADAYSTRHINQKTEKKSYYPACSAKFQDGCQIKKKQSPCDDCEARKLVPLTVDTFVKHLRGDLVIGLYLIKEESVRVAAVDFDDHSDGTAATAPDPRDAPLVRGQRFVDAAKEIGVTAFLERSGGGRGCHTWVFFSEWVPTTIARKLVKIILVRAGLPTDVEIFPRQRDARKFGNLIGLPYQDGPDHWRVGSAFLDPETLDLVDPLATMDAIVAASLQNIDARRLVKEHGSVSTKDDEIPATRDTAPVEAPTESVLVANPLRAVFDGCAALRAVRDDPPDPTARHGLKHTVRLALASVIRNLPGGRAEIHRIIAEKCGPDYDAAKTDSQIDSLTGAPMLCETLQSGGICPCPCTPILQRNNKSPVAFAYQRGEHEDGKVVIKISTDERGMYDAALLALRSNPDMYQRGGLLMAVKKVEEPKRLKVENPSKTKITIKRDVGTPNITLIPEAWISSDLTKVAKFIKYTNKNGWTLAEPPRSVVRQLYDPRYLTGIRLLRGVTESPQQRPDGTLITAPGYDPATAIYYQPIDDIPPVIDSPTLTDALQARDTLLDCVSEFPFADEAGKAAWLALVLTYFARPAIDGSLPLFVIDANVRGAGKSLLAQVAAIIMTGRKAATMNWTKDEAENKKALTAIFIAGDPVVLFDNVEYELGGAALNMALTSPIWNDRILGETRTTGRMPMTALLMATSNNATFGKDTIRRTIHIRIESPLEHPEDRDDMSRPEMENWTHENRVPLAHAALTILKAFALAQPKIKLTPMGNYVDWTKRIRALVVWLGMPDPLQTQKVLATAADRDANELQALMDAMLYAAPLGEWCSASELLRRAEEKTPTMGTSGKWDGTPLRNVLLEHCPGRGPDGLPASSKLSGRLTHFRGRVAGGMSIASRPGSGHVTEWRVEQTVGRCAKTVETGEV